MIGALSRRATRTTRRRHRRGTRTCRRRRTTRRRRRTSRRPAAVATTTTSRRRRRGRWCRALAVFSCLAGRRAGRGALARSGSLTLSRGSRDGTPSPPTPPSPLPRAGSVRITRSSSKVRRFEGSKVRRFDSIVSAGSGVPPPARDHSRECGPRPAPVHGRARLVPRRRPHAPSPLPRPRRPTPTEPTHTTKQTTAWGCGTTRCRFGRRCHRTSTSGMTTTMRRRARRHRRPRRRPRRRPEGASRWVVSAAVRLSLLALLRPPCFPVAWSVPPR